MRKKDIEALLDACEKGKKEQFIHFTKKIEEMRKEVDDAKKGSAQLNKVMNSILVGAALDHGGSIRISKKHFELMDLWNYEVKDNGEEFVFVVTPKLSQDDLPFEKG